MREELSPSVSFSAEPGGAPVIGEFEEILYNLDRAVQARLVYESQHSLPLEDLFYVGGQLKSLIRRSEKALNNRDLLLIDTTIVLIGFRLKEAKLFYKYIVKRIAHGF